MTGSVRSSFARSLVVAGLLLQFVLTVVLIHRTTEFDAWIRGLLHGAGDSLGGAVALVLLILLIPPAWRGRGWALVVSVILQLGLVAGIVPYLASSFSHPQDFSAWLLNVTYFDVGLVAAGFGVVAALEAWKRAGPRGWRSVQGGAVWTLVGVWAGMVAVGVAVAGAPPPEGMVAMPAAAAVVLRMRLMSFQPSDLKIHAGEPTALVIVNESTESHSFDVDALQIHRRVPANSTTMVMVELAADQPVPFYCGIPGHKQAGMTGRLLPE